MHGAGSRQSREAKGGASQAGKRSLTERPTCTMCGKAVEKDREWVERVDGLDYTFDSQECALIFKKFRSVYGREFFKPA